MIATDKPHLPFAALSHPGEAREINEDRYSVTSYRTEPENRPILLTVVADGIGGHQAGEVAAQIAVDELVSTISSVGEGSPVATLRGAVIRAGRSISKASAQDEAFQGMGSTIAVAMIIGRQLYTTSVGDSRIYLLRGGAIRQISIDHTWVQEAINHGIITPEEARNHPNAHVLHRHMGGETDPEPDFRLRLSSQETDEQSLANQGMRLEAGDQILLCSDGLSDLVENHELQSVLENNPPKAAISQLIELARARGGHDNITAVVVAVPIKPEKAPRRGCLGAGLRTVVILLGIAAVVALALAATYRFGLWPWTMLGLPEATPSPTATQVPSTPTPSLTPTPAASDTPLPTLTPTATPTLEGPTTTPVG